MRAIHEPIQRSAVTSPTPLVKRIARDAVSSAQLRHAPVAGIVLRQHSNALFHPTGLSKRHRRALPPCTLHLSTILPVQSVRNLPGLNPQVAESPPHPSEFVELSAMSSPRMRG